MPAFKGATWADCEKEKNRRSRNRIEGDCSICGKKDHHAGELRSAKKNEKYGDVTADKKGGGKSKWYVCESPEHLVHKHCGLCKSLEHQTCKRQERPTEKDAMLTKLNVMANSEVGPMAAMMGAARRGSKEECKSYSGAVFHMPHARAGMAAYKKLSPRAFCP